VEAFGLAIVLLGGILAAGLFCLVLVKVVRRSAALAAFAFWISALLFALFLIEFLLVRSMGALSARDRLGPLFFLVHGALTTVAAPSAACLLLLGRRRSLSRWWPVAAMLCWLVGAVALFQHATVADALYGGDGAPTHPVPASG
jgi:hypothetical protein